MEAIGGFLVDQAMDYALDGVASLFERGQGDGQASAGTTSSGGGAGAVPTEGGAVVERRGVKRKRGDDKEGDGRISNAETSMQVAKAHPESMQSYRSVVVARPIDTFDIMQNGSFKHRHFLVWGTNVEPTWVAFEHSGNPGTNSLGKQVCVAQLGNLKALQINQLGTYCDEADFRWLQRMGGRAQQSSGIMQPSICNIKVDRIKGDLRFVGQGSPFITNADSSQPANNDRGVVMCQVGTGVENRVPILWHQYKLDGKHKPTGSFDNNTQANAIAKNHMGMKSLNDVVLNTFPFGTYVSAEPGKLSSAGNWRLWDQAAMPVGFGGHVSAGGNSGREAAVQAVKQMPIWQQHMKTLDLTECQGSIASWDHKMDNCFIAAQQTPATYNSYPRNVPLIARNRHIETRNGTGTAQVQNYRQQGYLDSYQLNNINGSQAVVAMTHIHPAALMYQNNATTGVLGRSQVKHPYLLPDVYVNAWGAPTMVALEDVMQPITIMAVLDTEIQFSYSRDRAINQTSYANAQTIEAMGSGALGTAQFLTMDGAVCGKDCSDVLTNPIVPLNPSGDLYPIVNPSCNLFANGTSEPWFVGNIVPEWVQGATPSTLVAEV